jgi:ADP-heptose:LPS heptosyltransferase
VASARLVVSGDTGMAHLASAYGTPSVLLFGPTPPARWGPPPDGPHTVIWHGYEVGDPSADEVSPALLGIHSAEVLAAAQVRLRAGRPAPAPPVSRTTPASV